MNIHLDLFGGVQADIYDVTDQVLKLHIFPVLQMFSRTLDAHASVEKIAYSLTGTVPG